MQSRSSTYILIRHHTSHSIISYVWEFDARQEWSIEKIWDQKTWYKALPSHTAQPGLTSLSVDGEHPVVRWDDHSLGMCLLMCHCHIFLPQREDITLLLPTLAAISITN